jgi:hypothetical protein
MSDYRQQQENEELQMRTVEALQHLYKGEASEDDVRLVAWLTGLDSNDITGERNGSVRK